MRTADRSVKVTEWLVYRPGGARGRLLGHVRAPSGSPHGRTSPKAHELSPSRITQSRPGQPEIGPSQSVLHRRRTACSMSLRLIPMSRSIRSSKQASSESARRARISALSADWTLVRSANTPVVQSNRSRASCRVLMPWTS